jgi:hypothetical protein
LLKLLILRTKKCTIWYCNYELRLRIHNTCPNKDSF